MELVRMFVKIMHTYHLDEEYSLSLSLYEFQHLKAILFTVRMLEHFYFVLHFIQCLSDTALFHSLFAHLLHPHTFESSCRIFRKIAYQPSNSLLISCFSFLFHFSIQTLFILNTFWGCFLRKLRQFFPSFLGLNKCLSHRILLNLTSQRSDWK